MTMQAFQSFQSKVVPLDMHNVDTDMIIPAQFLTKIDRDGYGQYLFHRLRAQDTDFVFNDSGHHTAEILLTRANFGCGSSREHAVWSLVQHGIKVIIAESYSDIFYNNATKNGLLTIALPADDITTLIQHAQQTYITMTVDLHQQAITSSSGSSFTFDYDPFHRECLLKGQDNLDYLLEATV